MRDKSDCSIFYYCADYIRYVQLMGGTYSRGEVCTAEGRYLQPMGGTYNWGRFT